MQATTTKNDLAVAFCLFCWIEALRRHAGRPTRATVLLAALALTFAAGSKLTGLLYGAAAGAVPLWFEQGPKTDSGHQRRHPAPETPLVAARDDPGTGALTRSEPPPAPATPLRERLRVAAQGTEDVLGVRAPVADPHPCEPGEHGDEEDEARGHGGRATSAERSSTASSAARTLDIKRKDPFTLAARAQTPRSRRRGQVNHRAAGRSDQRRNRLTSRIKSCDTRSANSQTASSLRLNVHAAPATNGKRAQVIMPRSARW
jgi:hypothetical protein